MRTINASSSAMQPASEQDDIVNSPNYEDIAVVELQLCISLTEPPRVSWRVFYL